MHFVRLVPFACAAAVIAACSSDSTVVAPRDDASAAVDVFTRLADSVARSGGDRDLSGAYGSLAEAVRMGGRVSPVIITIDGVPTTFMATAQLTEITPALCSDPAKCPATIMRKDPPVTLRTLVAWDQANPKRVIQLSAAADSEPIRAYLFPVLVPFAGSSASLVYFDGLGGTYFGSSGSQKFSSVTSDLACPAAGEGRPIIAIYPAPPRCTMADFVTSFSAKAEPSTFLASRNPATGSHSFSMLAQPVLGSRLQLTAIAPPLPPIIVNPSASLTATLSAKVDSVVTLTFTVTNPTTRPADVNSATSQVYDFTIMDAVTGALVWRWSAGMGFFQALTSRTIPPNGSLTFTERWKPAPKGNYIALGSLVSMSHRAEAKTSVVVP